MQGRDEEGKPYLSCEGCGYLHLNYSALKCPSCGEGRFPLPSSRLDLCNCYVKALDVETQMTLRWGSHDPECPTYRPSRDPVDAMYDGIARSTLKGDSR